MATNHIKKNGCTGLVLSGGAARGYAHLGVIKALNEEGIYPNMISGTSAGAIAGVLYADGYTPDEILEILGKNSRLDFLALTVPKVGLLKMTGMIRILKKNLRATTFEELKIPLIVTATNLHNARVEYFSSGELLRCIIASASIPIIFRPVVMNNISYVDGGVIDNLPVGPLERKCSFLIGSYVNSLEERDGFNSLIAIAERAFHLSVTKDLQQKKRKFDIYINPPELIKYNAFDQNKSHELFELGYRSCKEKITEYRNRPAKKRKGSA